MKSLLSILILLFGITLFSQQTTAQKDLLKKANENIKLLNTNPEKAFQEAKKIEKEAQKINAKEAELRAVNTIVYYYKTGNDFENMMITAKSLFNRAKEYNNPAYQTIAKIHLFDVYNFNKLYDNALRELAQGKEIINNANTNDSLVINTKMDLYVAYSNYYLLQKDYKNQLKYLKLTKFEYEKYSDENYKKILRYIYYSNLAGAYNELNMPDSAIFYAKYSMSLDNGKGRKDIRFFNFLTLGEAAIKKENYQEAVSLFRKAEKVESHNIIHLNAETLYSEIIEAYQKLNKNDSAKLYQQKQDSLKLVIAENQNKSLHKMLQEKDPGMGRIYIYIAVFVFVVMTGIIFLVVRKNRILARQEKNSQEYLSDVSANPTSENYSRLLELLKKNDPTFIIYFNETFPEFSSKIHSINSGISNSEIEFCALIKLKIPTKDIAKYKFIAPKTVLNKKYLLRNKLKIPNSIDIYQWFDDF